MENHFFSAWFTFILLFLRICFFSIFFPHIFFPCVLQNFCLLSVSPCLLPWVVLCCAVNLVFLPTVAFVFYHKFMWLTSRLRQAERGRQSAELDNRLFKQDFGDKINSLQLEMEELTRQRWREGAAITGWCGNSKAGQCEKGVSQPSYLHSVSAVPFSDIRAQKASHTSASPKSCRHPLCSKN